MLRISARQACCIAGSISSADQSTAAKPACLYELLPESGFVAQPKARVCHPHSHRVLCASKRCVCVTETETETERVRDAGAVAARDIEGEGQSEGSLRCNGDMSSILGRHSSTASWPLTGSLARSTYLHRETQTGTMEFFRPEVSVPICCVLFSERGSHHKLSAGLPRPPSWETVAHLPHQEGKRRSRTEVSHAWTSK